VRGRSGTILGRPPGSPVGLAPAIGNAGRFEVIANDDELMRLTARGDEEAFRQLVERWQQPMLAFLERMTGDREEARDLGQEAFYRVFVQASRYRPTGQFRSWLFSVAGNLARSRLRRQKVLRWIRFDARRHDQPSPQANAHEHLERAQRQDQVRRALARLPDRQRQAVLLQRFERMSYQEVAAAMGVTVPAVESLLQRAMASLRAQLGQTAQNATGSAGQPKPSAAPSADASP